MRVNGKSYRTVWMEGSTVFMIDQNLLPFEFKILECQDYTSTVQAIKNMHVRGAGAIGAAAGFAMAQAISQYQTQADRIAEAKLHIENSRPTAYNLFYAVERVFRAGIKGSAEEALTVANEDAKACKNIGIAGAKLIHNKGRIATHCNAGWLAFVDHGSALSPIYEAKGQNKSVFVYVDETRPRGQGARLTAWELKNENIEHAIIPDNAFAHYASKGMIDMVIVGADRIALNGDTANKIGTLEKAIVAAQYGIPFYVAAPTSTFDAHTVSGEAIKIEEREESEVTHQTGPDSNGVMRTIRVSSPGSSALNPAFDVTPSKLIKGYITDVGILGSQDIPGLTR